MWGKRISKAKKGNRENDESPTEGALEISMRLTFKLKQNSREMCLSKQAFIQIKALKLNDALRNYII